MTDGTLVVNFAALQHASGEIQTALSRLQTQLADLERDAAPVVAAWEGDARAAYDQRQAGWRRAAQELSAMLASIKRALDESAHEYQETERRNARLFE
jgi:ESAT-6 family protein